MNTQGSCGNSKSGIVLQLEDTTTYIKYRIFDVVGNGAYRKHLLACKDVGQKWAVDMNSSVVRVNAASKAIQVLINDLQQNKKTGLYTLCQTVVENNSPPIEQSTVMAECCVSGKQKCQCIVLKCKGRGAPCITVQSRFGHFILMLWTVFKMDLVIKSISKEFVENLKENEKQTMRQICDNIVKKNCEDIEKLSTALLHAMEHVHRSLLEALTVIHENGGWSMWGWFLRPSVAE
eukprot:1282502-Rhodomonas_salina.1